MFRLFTIALIFCQSVCLAQIETVYFQQFGTEQGLSSNFTTCFLKDSEGFMWIGTDAGVNRFDGYEFKIWRHDPADSTSLSHNRVYSLFEDSRNRLWVGTADGLNQFNKSTQSFEQFHANIEDTLALSNGTILDIEEDKDGNLWMVTYGGGLNRYDPNTGFFKAYLHDKEDSNSLKQNYNMSLHIDDVGIIWIGLAGWGLNRFDPVINEFKHIVFDIGYDEHNVPNNAIRTLHEDNHGQLWMGTEGGLNVFDKKSQKYIKHYEHDPEDPKSIASSYVVRILQNRDDKLWLGTSNGISYLDPNTGKSTNFYADEDTPGAIQDNSIYDMLFEKNGNVWLTTVSQGLSFGNKFIRPFEIFKHSNSKLIDLEEASIRGLSYNNKGNLCIATSRGLSIINEKDGSVREIANHENAELFITHKSLHCVFQDSKGRYWLGTDGNGLYVVELESKKIRHYTYDPADSSSIGGNLITSVLEQSDGTIWVGSFDGGLNKYDEINDSFKTFNPEVGNEQSLSDHRVTCLKIDSQGDLWVGTSYGLNKFDSNKENFLSLHPSEINEPGITQNEIQFVYEDKKGNIWVGTKGGLDKLNRQGIKLKNFSKKDGFITDQIMSLVEDENGLFWLGTSKGISRFDPTTEIIRNFDIDNGLPPGKSFYKGSAIADSEGRLYFGNKRGLYAFLPSEMVENEELPPVVITSFSAINENPNASSSMEVLNLDNDEITLEPEQNVFSIEYAALNFIANRKNQYAYMLEGFDNNWVDAGIRKKTTYTNLDPGTYIFRVKASNNIGLWNENGASLNIFILPPWYKTWWAYLLYFVMIGGISWYLIRSYLVQERLKLSLAMEKLELEKAADLDKMKTSFFTNVSHDLRTPLTLIIGPLQEFLRREGKTDPQDISIFKLMHRNGQILMRLINQLLDAAKLQSGNLVLRVEEQDLVAFSRHLFFSFESAARQKKVQWSFESSLEEIKIYFDPEKMEKVLYNLFSNALKFTRRKGKVSLKIQDHSEEQIKITITDDGIGISEKDLTHVFDRFYQASDSNEQYQGTGIGLALAKELLDLHHAEISIESKPGEGTTIEILLLKGSKHFQDSQIIVDSEFQLSDSIDDQYEPSNLTSPEPEEESKKPIVLIVEDNDDMRYYIRNNLNEDYTVAEANDGKQGLALACELVPDLIISDVMMPQMDGLEFCTAVKSDERTSHIPVILLTAKAAEANKLEGLETGADAYLTKPFNTEELSIRIKNLVQQRAELRKKFSRKLDVNPADISVVSTDERFLTKTLEVLESNMSNDAFTVEDFGSEVGLSRVQLHRKLKALTGLSTTEYIRNIRLKRAKQLMDQGDGNIAEISYKVGFADHSYFSKRFKETFDTTPKEYIESTSKNALKHTS